MNGGLGNQIFQYIFMRYIEETLGEECIIEDTEFFHTPEEIRNNPAYNGYQLERVFGIKKKRLSESLDRDVFDEVVRIAFEVSAPGELRKGIIPIFKEMGIDLFTVQEGSILEYECKYRGNTLSTPMNEFYPDVTKVNGDIYYYGYWINAQWFIANANKLLTELRFAEISDEKNRGYWESIKQSGNHSVAVHIRRGDFVKLGWALDSSIYEKMINEIRKKIAKPEFYIFSDDLVWVKDNYKEIGLKTDDKVIFIEGNFRETSYIDMQLMKECRGMVFSSSSFSYLASLLNTRKDKIIMQPTKRQIVYYS